MVNGNSAFVKNGTYTNTTASTNVTGGCLSLAVIATICGYSSTRTLDNTGTAPVWKAGAASTTLFVNTFGLIRNVTLDGNAQTTTKCFGGGYGAILCTIQNFNSASTAVTWLIDCTVTLNSAAILVVSIVRCLSTANTALCMQISGTGSAVDSIFASNTGASTIGLYSAGPVSVTNCTFYTNGQYGFQCDATAQIDNCIFEGNVTAGANLSSAATVLRNCASFNNTKLAGTYMIDSGAIALSASPFTNAGSGDFSLNTTSGGGAACRAAGIPGTLGSSTGHADVGAIQHADPAGGGGGGGSPVQIFSAG